MDADGDGDGSSSSDVSTTAADEGPRADPELTQPNASPPPTDPYSTENFVAQMQLYDRNMLLHMVQLDPNMEADYLVFFRSSSSLATTVTGETDYPRHGDADADADTDAGADNAYGSLIVGAVPASGVAIACLPETTVGEGEGRESGGECAVCLDEYVARDALRTMPCAHGIHERCIFKWLRASRLCPLCRFALLAEEDTETDGEEDERDAGHDDDSDSSALEYL